MKTPNLNISDTTLANKSPECIVTEDMLTDALDGTLTAADQRWLDHHVATCAACSAMLADAKCGAAWLDILKQTRPEPSPDLFTRIMAQTAGQALGEPQVAAVADDQGAPAEPACWNRPLPVLPLHTPTNLLQFPAARRSPFGRLFINPRLAMTAAMAFFSIALTLNMTGVRLDEMHASDLSPHALRRSFYQARAGAVREYDSLHVVQVLESRVDDIRQVDQRIDTPAPRTQPAPQSQDRPGVLRHESDQPQRMLPGSLKKISAAPAEAAPAENPAQSSGLLALNRTPTLGLLAGGL